MNMSEDIAGSTVQMMTKGAEVAAHAAKASIDLIMKLIAQLSEIAKEAQRAADRVRSTNLTNIPAGKVPLDQLTQNARATGDALSFSQNGVTSADMRHLEQFAKKNHFPIAFVQSGDSYFPVVRNSDSAMLKMGCTDMLKSKIAERPQELGNFKVQDWEMPFLAAEFNKYDIPASFAKTKSGENLCLFEKSDEKAIGIARKEFVSKCSKLNEQYAFDRDENGYYTIKELRSGREMSFDRIPTRSEVAEMAKQRFGFDDNLANMCAAKFGEDMLHDAEKQQYFSDNAQQEFSRIETNVTLDGENVLVKPYDCWYLTEKKNQTSSIVFQSDSGQIAVLQPGTMSRKEMTDTLTAQLQTDPATTAALIDKAERVSDYYVRQDAENYSLDYTFTKDNFVLSDPSAVTEMRRTDADGNVFAKELPVTAIANQIERTGADSFTVSSTVTSVEKDQNGVEHPSHDTQQLILSFSDKKNAVFELASMYKKQGVPDHIAKQMAEDAFKRANAQSPEKVLQVEEIRVDQTRYDDNSIFADIELRCGSKSSTQKIDLAKPDAAKEQLVTEFGVSDAAAERAIERAAEHITEHEQEVLHSFGFENTDDWTLEQGHELIKELEQNGWKVPDGIDPAVYDPNESIRSKDNGLLDSIKEIGILSQAQQMGTSALAVPALDPDDLDSGMGAR